MASVEMKGLDEYTRAISRLEQGAKDKIIGPMVYEGASVAANEIRAQMEAIPTDESWGTPWDLKAGPSKFEKEAIIRALGISHMRDDDGFRNVKIGFDGYDPIRTKRWPKGRPIAMLARSVNKGTSFMVAHPFMKTATRRCRKRVISAMQKKFAEEAFKMMEADYRRSLNSH